MSRPEIETMTEQAMVDELIDDHGLERYNGKKIETTHWGKEQLQQLTISAREVEKAIGEGQGKALDDMDRDAVKAELDHRQVEYKKKAKTETLKGVLREARVNYAMIAFGYMEGGEDFPAGAGSTDPDAKSADDKPNMTIPDDEKEKPPAPKLPPPTASRKITAGELANSIKNGLDALVPPAVALDIKNALATGQKPRIRGFLHLPGGKRVPVSTVFE